MGQWIDEVARALASGIPRREALKRIGGGFAAAVGAAMLPGQAEAQTCPTGTVSCPGGACCPGNQGCRPNTPGACGCPNPQSLCGVDRRTRNAICCPPGPVGVCSNGNCTCPNNPNTVVCTFQGSTFCCPAGTTCGSNGNAGRCQCPTVGGNPQVACGPLGGVQVCCPGNSQAACAPNNAAACGTPPCIGPGGAGCVGAGQGNCCQGLICANGTCQLPCVPGSCQNPNPICNTTTGICGPCGSNFNSGGSTACPSQPNINCTQNGCEQCPGSAPQPCVGPPGEPARCCPGNTCCIVGGTTPTCCSNGQSCEQLGGNNIRCCSPNTVACTGAGQGNCCQGLTCQNGTCRPPCGAQFPCAANETCNTQTGICSPCPGTQVRCGDALSQVCCEPTAGVCCTVGAGAPRCCPGETRCGANGCDCQPPNSITCRSDADIANNVQTNFRCCGGNTPLCNRDTGACITACPQGSTACPVPGNPSRVRCCSGATPNCNTNTGVCQAGQFCNSSNDCPNTAAQPFPICSQNQCRGCQTGECQGGTPVCDPSGRCLPCQSSAGTGGPDICPTTAPICIGGTCFACNADFNECGPAGPGCAPCPANSPICVGPTCQTCAQSTGNANATVCVGGPPGAGNGAVCCLNTPQSTCCDGACVNTTNDPNNCGGCGGSGGQICQAPSTCNNGVCCQAANSICTATAQCCAGNVCQQSAFVPLPTQGVCQPQPNAQCPSGLVCGGICCTNATGGCQPNGTCPCRNDGDCPAATPVCNAATGRCVACTQANQNVCVAPQVCQNNVCCVGLQTTCATPGECCQGGGTTLCQTVGGGAQTVCCRPSGGQCNPNQPGDCCGDLVCGPNGTCGSCPACTTTPHTGAITVTDSVKQTRLARLGAAETCGPPAKVCPGVVAAPGNRFDLWEFQNNSQCNRCVTVEVTTSCGSPAFTGGPDNRIFVAAYQGNQFDANNLCTNYIGDIGAEPDAFGGTTSFSFDIPAGSVFLILVEQVGTDFCAPDPNVGSFSYTLNVTCAEITPNGAPPLFTQRRRGTAPLPNWPAPPPITDQ